MTGTYGRGADTVTVGVPVQSFGSVRSSIVASSHCALIRGTGLKALQLVPVSHPISTVGGFA